jgi:hypothetical protein
LVVRKKNAMDTGKKAECIRLVRKKYNRLARRNGEHHIEMIKYFEWGGGREDCIDMEEKLRHRGRRNA